MSYLLLLLLTSSSLLSGVSTGSPRSTNISDSKSGTDLNVPPVDCEILPDIQHGEIIYNRSNTFSIATYSCDEGYVLDWTPALTCDYNGSWSHQPPSCTSYYSLLSLLPKISPTNIACKSYGCWAGTIMNTQLWGAALVCLFEKVNTFNDNSISLNQAQLLSESKKSVLFL